MRFVWGRAQVKKFWIVAFVFLGTIYANMKTLQYANVETFIVFRSSTSQHTHGVSLRLNNRLLNAPARGAGTQARRC